MLFLFAKQYWHDYELILLPFALILIISAHIFNFRYYPEIHRWQEEARCGKRRKTILLSALGIRL